MGLGRFRRRLLKNVTAQLTGTLAAPGLLCHRRGLGKYLTGEARGIRDGDGGAKGRVGFLEQVAFVAVRINGDRGSDLDGIMLLAENGWPRINERSRGLHALIRAVAEPQGRGRTQHMTHSVVEGCGREIVGLREHLAG